MKCPVCKETHLVISEKKGIEIDYCPDCRGIWLDRGELDKIIEKSKAAEEGPSTEKAQPFYPNQQAPNQQHQPTYYKKRKSFLEELFD
jgi:Zn-finger nucleic acid-binding protein